MDIDHTGKSNDAVSIDNEHFKHIDTEDYTDNELSIFLIVQDSISTVIELLDGALPGRGCILASNVDCSH